MRRGKRSPAWKMRRKHLLWWHLPSSSKWVIANLVLTCDEFVV